MDISNNTPWHAGERTWHERLGVALQMQALGERVIRDALPEQHRNFFTQLPFIVTGYETKARQVWASMLAGHPVLFPVLILAS